MNVSETKGTKSCSGKLCWDEYYLRQPEIEHKKMGESIAPSHCQLLVYFLFLFILKIEGKSCKGSSEQRAYDVDPKVSKSSIDNIGSDSYCGVESAS